MSRLPEWVCYISLLKLVKPPEFIVTTCIKGISYPQASAMSRSSVRKSRRIVPEVPLRQGAILRAVSTARVTQGRGAIRKHIYGRSQ